MLIDHVSHVVAATEKISEYLILTPENRKVAKMGAILHDIGKVNPIFQERLDRKIEENIDDPYRHELASLFFLPLADMQYWPILIEMIVAHHRSIKDDARRQGVLDLDDDYDTQLVDIHLQDWEKWSLVALAILEKFQITIRTISRCEATEAFA